MQARYIPTSKDVQAVKRLLSRGRYMLAMMVPVLLLTALIIYVFYEVEQLSQRLWLDLIGAIYAYFLLTMALRFFLRKGLSTADPDSIDVETTAVIAPAGITFLSPRRVLQYAWDCFSDVKLTKHYLLLYTSPIRAHYIPTRAFYDEREAHDFMAQIEDYRGASRLAQPVPLNAPGSVAAVIGTDSASPAAVSLPGADSGESVWPPRPQMR